MVPRRKLIFVNIFPNEFYGTSYVGIRIDFAYFFSFVMLELLLLGNLLPCVFWRVSKSRRDFGNVCTCVFFRSDRLDMAQSNMFTALLCILYYFIPFGVDVCSQ